MWLDLKAVYPVLQGDTEYFSKLKTSYQFQKARFLKKWKLSKVYPKLYFYSIRV